MSSTPSARAGRAEYSDRVAGSKVIGEVVVTER